MKTQYTNLPITSIDDSFLLSSDTFSVTASWPPTTYIDDLIKHVRNTRLVEDARHNAETIVNKEVRKSEEKIKEKYWLVIWILVFGILLENMILFYF